VPGALWESLIAAVVTCAVWTPLWWIVHIATLETTTKNALDFLETQLEERAVPPTTDA